MAILVAIMAGSFSLASASYARALDATPVRVPILGATLPPGARTQVRRAGGFIGLAGGLTGALISQGQWEWGIGLLICAPPVLVCEWLRWQHNAAVDRSATTVERAA